MLNIWLMGGNLRVPLDRTERSKQIVKVGVTTNSAND